VSLLEAAQALLQQGFRPARSLLFAFGHDEEVGGRLGAGEGRTGQVRPSVGR
jgi:carboxypeptidase PM20D1